MQHGALVGFSASHTSLGQKCILAEPILLKLKLGSSYGVYVECRRCVQERKGGRLTLTLDGEDHALTNVGAHTVRGLTQIIPAVIFQHVADEQGAIRHDLDAAGKRDGVVLLGVSNTCNARET